MPNHDELITPELTLALRRSQAFLEDARDERAYLRKQSCKHIKVAEVSHLERLDRDVEKFQAQVNHFESLLQAQALAQAL